MSALLVFALLLILWYGMGFIALRIDPTYEPGDWTDPLGLMLMSFGPFALWVALYDRHDRRKEYASADR